MSEKNPTWTEQDERKLKAAIEDAAFWRQSLNASVNATCLREGSKARTERRQLITRAERMIADLRMRKSAAENAMREPAMRCEFEKRCAS